VFVEITAVCFYLFRFFLRFVCAICHGALRYQSVCVVFKVTQHVFENIISLYWLHTCIETIHFLSKAVKTIGFTYISAGQ